MLVSVIKQTKKLLYSIEKHRASHTWYWRALVFVKDTAWSVVSLPPILIPSLYVESFIESRQRKKIFSKLKTCCIFIGYPRSGHSLVGALLDAHPNIAIAHEVDMLKFVKYGFSREQLAAMLIDAAAHGARFGRSSEYDYSVPGQSQGVFSNLTVVGDKRGGATSDRLKKDFGLFDRLVRCWGDVNVKCIHVIRNPFDIIATISRKHELSLPAAADWFFSLVKVCEKIKLLRGDAVLDIFHESFLASPRHELRRACAFLGVSASDDYLDACSKIVWTTPHLSRHDVVWTPELITSILLQCKEISFLSHYRYDQ